MNWERLDGGNDEGFVTRQQHGDDPPGASRTSPLGYVHAALYLAAGGLLLFNAIGLARIEDEVERRVAVSQAATNARLRELERQVVELRENAGLPPVALSRAAPSPLPPPPSPLQLLLST